ncbi:hypothetical protein [Rhizobium sp. R635]|uniref:hypothetical protein n=1 Tax=unclassified Rhizobium TaxID=2613769 RepID=UPI00167D167F|nr:hypothetical protein [Rhizobium sp. R635]
MTQAAERRAFMIYIGAIVAVGLVIALGAAISSSSGTGGDRSAPLSREANP